MKSPVRRGRGLQALQQTMAESDTAPGRAGRHRRGGGSCFGAPIPLGQHNFTRLLDDLSGCYKQVEDITLGQDLSQRLPIGNQSRPFNGALDGAGHTLSVNLTRAQGDALLFGAIDNSRIDLAVINSRLETRNGSQAALIGAMGDGNRVTLSRLYDSIIKATGEGTVEAGLVASTQGAGNRVELTNARGNRIEARAFPSSQGCADACLHRAAVSLGLGMLRPGLVRTSVQHSGELQTIIQHQLNDNQVQAWAGYRSAQSVPGNSRAEATAGLLGILGDDRVVHPQLSNGQKTVHNNQVVARAQDLPGTTGQPGAGGRSCASLGYGALRCALTSSVASREEYSSGPWLWMSQTGCRNNSVQAWSGPSSYSVLHESGQAQDGVARATLTSVAPLRLLFLQQDAVGPGQLKAEAHRGLAERALLAPTREAWLLLYAGGDAWLPALASWDGALNECTIFSVWDTAGYQLGDFNCNSTLTRVPVERLQYDSRQPWAWRWAHDSLRYSEFSYLQFKEPSCKGHDSALHYPNEALQTLVQSASEWFLVTRQHYPWKPENDQQGLLRATRYRIPAGTVTQPQTEARAEDRGVILYKARAGDALLKNGLPVASLVQGQQLYQLYQGAGEPIQLISLAVDATDGTWRLAQYDALAGSARLLSVEDGELHLWTQGSNDTVQAYGLGDEPLNNASSWLHWGFDLSDQPGHRTLLARAGDWLYSLRQADGQAASLRRRHISTGERDTRWQAAWPANVTDDLRLLVAGDQLIAVPAGTLPDPRTPHFGFQARVPDRAGCLQWSRMALDHYPLPVDPTASANSTTLAPAPSGSPGAPARYHPLSGVAIIGLTVGLGGGLGLVCVCTMAIAQCVGGSSGRSGREDALLDEDGDARDDAAEEHNGEPPEAIALRCTLAVETAV